MATLGLSYDNSSVLWINYYISREISIEHPCVGLASLAQLVIFHRPLGLVKGRDALGVSTEYVRLSFRLLLLWSVLSFYRISQ